MPYIELYPLTFKPVLKDYVWGGRNLERLYGRPLPAGIVAESWEVAAHANGVTHVEAGPLQGKSLRQVLDFLGSDLVGTRSQWALKRGKFPLLVKLLDAEQDLSVQVHPGDDYAFKHEDGELGKTEMWYVLDSKPGARIVYGLKPGVGRQTLRRALENDTVPDQLHYGAVRPGDAVFVKAGTIHALLKGTVVAEIQQNSDATYRLYDWGRLGVDGRPRELQVEKALDVIDFDSVAPAHSQPRPRPAATGVSRTEIGHCRYFAVEKVGLAPGAAIGGRTDGGTFEIWGTIDGLCRLTWAGQALSLPAIRWVLIPASMGEFGIEAGPASTMLRVYVP
jgi:mannose-6-phosphate isomerase